LGAFIKERGIKIVANAKKERAMMGYIDKFMQKVMVIGPKKDPS